MSARSKARKRALDILFEADQRGLNALDLLRERQAEKALANEYTADLVEGVVAHWRSIDEAVATYAHGWSMERMPAVDRAVLRLGVWEVVYNDEIPDGVAISEAVALAKELSTDDSPSFVNGLLGRVAEVKDTIA